MTMHRPGARDATDHQRAFTDLLGVLRLARVKNNAPADVRG